MAVITVEPTSSSSVVNRNRKKHHIDMYSADHRRRVGKKVTAINEQEVKRKKKGLKKIPSGIDCSV